MVEVPILRMLQTKGEAREWVKKSGLSWLPRKWSAESPDLRPGDQGRWQHRDPRAGGPSDLSSPLPKHSFLGNKAPKLWDCPPQTVKAPGQSSPPPPNKAFAPLGVPRLNPFPTAPSNAGQGGS